MRRGAGGSASSHELTLSKLRSSCSLDRHSSSATRAVVLLCRTPQRSSLQSALMRNVILTVLFCAVLYIRIRGVRGCFGSTLSYKSPGPASVALTSFVSIDCTLRCGVGENDAGGKIQFTHILGQILLLSGKDPLAIRAWDRTGMIASAALSCSPLQEEALSDSGVEGKALRFEHLYSQVTDTLLGLCHGNACVGKISMCPKE